MITWILIMLAICCVVGIFTGEIALGVVFAMSLLITLYGLFSLLQKDKLTNLGLIIVIVGVMSLIYTICELFLGMNIKTILGF